MTCFYKGVDYANRTIGCYRILEFDTNKTFPGGQKRPYWKVQCIHCNTIKSMSCYRVLNKQQKGCSSCVKDRFSGCNSPNWNNANIKNVSSYYYHRLKAAAEKRKLKFEVSRKFLDELFEKQNGKCNYTGYDIYFGNNQYTGTASLDRMDNTIGYTETNVQWVHKDVNVIKWDLSHQRFLEICKVITENNNARQ